MYSTKRWEISLVLPDSQLCEHMLSYIHLRCIWKTYFSIYWYWLTRCRRPHSFLIWSQWCTYLLISRDEQKVRYDFQSIGSLGCTSVWLFKYPRWWDILKVSNVIQAVIGYKTIALGSQDLIWEELHSLHLVFPTLLVSYAPR